MKMAPPKKAHAFVAGGIFGGVGSIKETWSSIIALAMHRRQREIKIGVEDKILRRNSRAGGVEA